MCQDRVLDVLRSNTSRWWSARAINDLVNDINLTSVNMNLKQLTKYDVIIRKDSFRGKYPIYLYRIKNNKFI